MVTYQNTGIILTDNRLLVAAALQLFFVCFFFNFPGFGTNKGTLYTILIGFMIGKNCHSLHQGIVLSGFLAQSISAAHLCLIITLFSQYFTNQII